MNLKRPFTEAFNEDLNQIEENAEEDTEELEGEEEIPEPILRANKRLLFFSAEEEDSYSGNASPFHASEDDGDFISFER